jgi:hypothetical protein
MAIPKALDLNTQTTPLVGLKNTAVPKVHPTTPLDTKTPPGTNLVTNIPWSEKTKVSDQYLRK